MRMSRGKVRIRKGQEVTRRIKRRLTRDGLEGSRRTVKFLNHYWEPTMDFNYPKWIMNGNNIHSDVIILHSSQKVRQRKDSRWL